MFFKIKNIIYNKTNKRKHTLALVFAMVVLLLCPFLSFSQDVSKILDLFQRRVAPTVHSERFGALPAQSIDGRIEPVNTISSEILRKLHHSDRIGNLTSDQFLLSVMTMPEMWMQVPLIYLKNKDISKQYGLGEKYVAFSEVFDDRGRYLLSRDVRRSFAKPAAERSKFDKDLLKFDEQIHIFSQLSDRQMLKLFPSFDSENHEWIVQNPLLDDYLSAVYEALFPADGISEADDWADADALLDSIADFQKQNTTIGIDSGKMRAELLYNRLSIFKLCKKFYFVLGAHLLAFAFVALFKRKKSLQTGIWIQVALIVGFLAYHLFGIGLRWYIAGYAPWSNAYETMVYVSFITVAAGLIFARRSAITVALATIFGGVILFVSGLNRMDPQITPLVPVLKSPWLMIHVAVIVAAYGFFGVGFLIGITNTIMLSLKKIRSKLAQQIAQLTVINELALWIGLMLMTIGTFVGAVWANESWGRYWGWDPKETWALITVVVYAIALHLRLVKKWDRPVVLNLASIIAFGSVLMTYFGVNYFLAGMHSYGN